MKKLLILLVGIISAISISAQNMPYILKYKVDKSKLDSYCGSEQEGDTTMFHNISNIDKLYINSKEHSLDFKNFEREDIPISAIDTVYVYHDKFQILENRNDWTEIIFSTEQIYFYKENAQTGNPEALLFVTRNDTLPNGHFSYVSFDDNGKPKYMNLNGQHFFIKSIYNDHYEAIVINPDSSFIYIDSIPLPHNTFAVYDKVITRSGYTQTKAQIGLNLFNHFVGGVTMIAGGYAILTGCAMLVPGANIAVGATIAIAGVATFLSGAFLTTRATDLLISDGSHTDNFDIASNLLGLTGTIAGGGGIASKVAQVAFSEGCAGAQVIVDANADMNQAYLRAKKIVEGRVTTGRAELYDIQSNSVLLHGHISKKMNANDKVGILISKDENALNVEDCSFSEISENGDFNVLFENLIPTQKYYYRAFYYSTEFEKENYNPYLVSNVMSFVMPGVSTVGHDENGNQNYTIHGKVAWLKSDNTHIVGVCYSQLNRNPTIDDEHKEVRFDGEGDFSISLSLTDGGYYYRTYAIFKDDVVYGEVMYLTDERSMLIQLYNDTNGPSWTDNTNWCSEKPLGEWYGINNGWMISDHVRIIDLKNNNLSGNIDIKSMKYLEDIMVTGNDISSITIDNCPSLDLGYGFKGLDGIKLDNLTINNCFYDYDQHFLGDYLGTTTIKNIVFSNMQKLGRVFFDGVISDKITFQNCHFDHQGVGVEFNSNVNTLIIDNCTIPSGRAGGTGIEHLVIKNSRIGDFWVIEAKSSITIINSLIEGHLVNKSGSPEEIHEYMWKLLR